MDVGPRKNSIPFENTVTNLVSGIVLRENPIKKRSQNTQFHIIIIPGREVTRIGEKTKRLVRTIKVHE